MNQQEHRVAELLETAVRHHRAGQLREAENLYRQILALDPNHVDSLHLLGIISHHAGRNDVAANFFGKAIALNGKVPDFHNNLGNALLGLGKSAEAAASYRQALALKPDYPEAHSNLGYAFALQGNFAEAASSCEQALALRPDYPEALNNYGAVLLRLGRLAEATASFERAASVKPDFADAFINLGVAFYRQGRFAEALTVSRKAQALRPDLAEPHDNIGHALMGQGQFAEAVASFERAVALNPSYAEGYNNIGIALKALGRLADAAAACERALALRPNFAHAHNNLGAALKDQGRMAEARARFERALAIDPSHTDAIHNLLYSLNFAGDVPLQAIYEKHAGLGRQLGSGAEAQEVHGNSCDPGRRLRVGYVSPDFRRHSVAFFIEPLLRNHDHSAVEVFCYAEVTQPDAVTGRLRALADHWTVTVGMSDETLAARIRADGIDVLVDLAGHTSGNRLPVFVLRPAPVQVTWLGYPNTTGLAAIDYRLVDAITDPEDDAASWSSETLMRLTDGFVCYGPPADAPEPALPPCLAGAAVTFGSFNNPAKLSDITLDAWAALLRRLPQSRLLLKGLPFVDAAARDLFHERLAKRGIAPDRVELVGRLADDAQHLAFYRRLDIALDPFPYNGTTTTCEALWMGVPVVTLRGDRHAGRVGASLLHRLDLDELIARDADDYVDIAVALATADCLADLRRGLRDRMRASSLCDGPTFARAIETAYREMWRRWCEKTGAGMNGVATETGLKADGGAN